MRLLVMTLLLGVVPGVMLAQSGTQVVMLGTGTPNPDPERSGPAVAIVVNGTSYLVDAGPGVMRRAAAAAAKHSLPALGARNIGIVFLTHLHSDHTVGLPDVMHTSWVAERPQPLRVFGPAGTARMVEHLQAAWSEDILIRTTGRQPHTSEGWKVNATDITAGVVYQDSNVVVRAFRVPHPEWEYAYGYRFETADRTVVISGDTGPSDAVVTACNGCDVLVHEVYSAKGFQTRTADWQGYHIVAHTSTTDLADLATRARPGLLVLYHQLYWGDDDAGLLAEVAARYSGRTVSARDLDIY
jgi:ribonuclease BN (tRNA processing enzyme)